MWILASNWSHNPWEVTFTPDRSQLSSTFKLFFPSGLQSTGFSWVASCLHISLKPTRCRFFCLPGPCPGPGGTPGSGPGCCRCRRQCLGSVWCPAGWCWPRRCPWSSPCRWFLCDFPWFSGWCWCGAKHSSLHGKPDIWEFCLPCFCLRT